MGAFEAMPQQDVAPSSVSVLLSVDNHARTIHSVNKFRRVLLVTSSRVGPLRAALNSRAIGRSQMPDFEATSQRTYDVFTPTTPARLTFVERGTVNDRLVNALRTPGKQLVVYGHSGSGKTTLLVNKLHQLYERHITTRCMTGLTFNQILSDAFEQLAPFYHDSLKHATGVQLDTKLTADYSNIKAELGLSRKDDRETTSRLILPPQLTPQTLARFLGAAGCCWVLEDFHKIGTEEKRYLSQAMKVFMDLADEHPAVRIVAIGAVGTARQVIEYDPEMRNRVAEVNVPLMTEAEISGIIAKGARLLNVQIPAKVQRGIVHYSNGLPAVTHQLCLNLCLAAGVEESASVEVAIGEERLHAAVDQYLDEASDTLKSAFDRALRVRKSGKFENTRLIIRALRSMGEDGATHHELLTKIRADAPHYPAGNLSHFLDRLQEASRGAVVRFDAASGRYSFADPLYKVFAQALFRESPTGDSLKGDRLTSSDIFGGHGDPTVTFQFAFATMRKELVEAVLQSLTEKHLLNAARQQARPQSHREAFARLGDEDRPK